MSGNIKILYINNLDKISDACEIMIKRFHATFKPATKRKQLTLL